MEDGREYKKYFQSNVYKWDLIPLDDSCMHCKDKGNRLTIQKLRSEAKMFKYLISKMLIF